MAQESWKMDADETGCQPPDGPTLCSNNCTFFGSATTMNLCSKCYRDATLKEAEAAKAAAAISAVRSEISLPRQSQQKALISEAGTSTQSVENESLQGGVSSVQPKQSNRCFSCKRRLGLTGFKCRCGNLFCSLHRYNDKHNCSFDYRGAARDAIAKANPVVKAEKFNRI